MTIMTISWRQLQNILAPLAEDRWITSIKELRAATSISLKEAKDIIDSIKTLSDKEEALKTALRKCGYVIEGDAGAEDPKDAEIAKLRAEVRALMDEVAKFREAARVAIDAHAHAEQACATWKDVVGCLNRALALVAERETTL